MVLCRSTDPSAQQSSRPHLGPVVFRSPGWGPAAALTSERNRAPCPCHVMSYHVTSCPVLYCPVLSCPVLSWHVLSCPVLSWHVLSCPVLSWHVLSCPDLSCPVLSCPCPVLSCPALSCPILSCPVLSCHVLSCPVLSCPVLSCPVLSWHVLSCPVMSCHVPSPLGTRASSKHSRNNVCQTRTTPESSRAEATAPTATSYEFVVPGEQAFPKGPTNITAIGCTKHGTKMRRKVGGRTQKCSASHHNMVFL